MPLNQRNTRTVSRTVYCGLTHSVILLKRNDDQNQGTVRQLLLFRCRRSSIVKTGESIQADIEVGSRTVWHIPATELARVGVAYLNNLDRIVDVDNSYWQPEATTEIHTKLLGNEVDIFCLRIDPPLKGAV